MNAERAWDWEISYDLGPERCGALGTVSSEAEAAHRIESVLAALPAGVPARGQLMLMGAVRAGRRPLLSMVARVERTSDGRIVWTKP